MRCYLCSGAQAVGLIGATEPVLIAACTAHVAANPQTGFIPVPTWMAGAR